VSEFRINKGQLSLFDPVQLLVALGPEIFRKALEVSQFSFFFFFQEEMKIKNKVNVKRTFMREREIYLYWSKIYIMSLKTNTQLKKKKGN
jgi:hypothetical protein